MPTQTDPARFNDKAFTRKPTFKNAVNDYRVLIDGLTAGRIMEMRLSFGVVKWLWTVTGPYLSPELQPGNGQEETLEQAQQAFKVKFWQWHGSALTQRTVSVWHGAEP